MIPPGTQLGAITVGAHVPTAKVKEHPLYAETEKSYLLHGKLRECTCKCGTVKLISESALKGGKIKSCGCGRGRVKLHLVKVDWEPTARKFSELWRENTDVLKVTKLDWRILRVQVPTNPKAIAEIEVLLTELYRRRRILDLIRHGQLTPLRV